MKITRLRVLAAALAGGAVAVATGTALALGGSQPEASAIHGCRHPNGGCVRASAARLCPAGHGKAGTVEAMRDRRAPTLEAMPKP
jgi:hypothetical protein